MSRRWFIVKTAQHQMMLNSKEEKRVVRIDKKFPVSITTLSALPRGAVHLITQKGCVYLEREAGEEDIETGKSFSTEMAREKYVRRRKEKKNRSFQVLSVTPYTLCDFYLSRGKMFCIDTLGRMFRAAAVKSSGRYLVCEEDGLITGALMYKTDELCEIVSLHFSETPPACFLASDNPEDSSRCRYRKIEPELGGFSDIPEESFDSLFICASEKQSVEAICTVLVAKVCMAGSVVVYSPHKELLFGLYGMWMDSREYIDVSLTESYSRRYRHVNGITHMQVDSNSYSGYVISARKVLG